MSEQTKQQAWQLYQDVLAQMPPVSQIELMMGQARVGADLLSAALNMANPQLAAELESAIAQAEFAALSRQAVEQIQSQQQELEQEPEPQPEPEPQAQEQEGQAQAGAEPEQAVEPQQEAEPQPEPVAEAEPEPDAEAEPQPQQEAEPQPQEQPAPQQEAVTKFLQQQVTQRQEQDQALAAKPWQLADDPETYGDKAGHWIVVSADGENELAGGPWPDYERAEQEAGYINRMAAALAEVREGRMTAKGLDAVASTLIVPGEHGVQSMDDLDDWTGTTQVRGCIEIEQAGEKFVDEVPPEEAQFFGVYVGLEDGSMMWHSDHPTQEQANAVAQRLEAIHDQAKVYQSRETQEQTVSRSQAQIDTMEMLGYQVPQHWTAQEGRVAAFVQRDGAMVETQQAEDAQVWALFLADDQGQQLKVAEFTDDNAQAQAINLGYQLEAALFEYNYAEQWREAVALAAAREAIDGQVLEGIKHGALSPYRLALVFEEHFKVSGSFANSILDSAVISKPQELSVDAAFEVLGRYPGLAEKVREEVLELGGNLQPEPQPEPEPQAQEQEGQAQAGAEPEQAVEPQQEAEPQPEPEAEAEPEPDAEAEPQPQPQGAQRLVPVFDMPTSSVEDIARVLRQAWELHTENGWQPGKLYPVVLNMDGANRYLLLKSTDTMTGRKSITASMLAGVPILGRQELVERIITLNRSDKMSTTFNLLSTRPGLHDEYRQAQLDAGFPSFTDEMLENPKLYYAPEWHGNITAKLVSPEEYRQQASGIQVRQPVMPQVTQKEEQALTIDLFSEPQPPQPQPGTAETRQAKDADFDQLLDIMGKESEQIAKNMEQWAEDTDEYMDAQSALDFWDDAVTSLKRDINTGVVARFDHYRTDYPQTHAALQEVTVKNHASLLQEAQQRALESHTAAQLFDALESVRTPHDLLALRDKALGVQDFYKGAIDTTIAAGSLAYAMVQQYSYDNEEQQRSEMKATLMRAAHLVNTGNVRIVHKDELGNIMSNMPDEQVPQQLESGVWIEMPEYQGGEKTAWMQIQAASTNSPANTFFYAVADITDGQLRYFSSGLSERQPDNPILGLERHLFVSSAAHHEGITLLYGSKDAAEAELMTGYVGRLGLNSNGDLIRIDGRGLRTYTQDGIRVTEPVHLAYTQQGVQGRVRVSERDGSDFETVVEAQARVRLEQSMERVQREMEHQQPEQPQEQEAQPGNDIDGRDVPENWNGQGGLIIGYEYRDGELTEVSGSSNKAEFWSLYLKDDQGERFWVEDFKGTNARGRAVDLLEELEAKLFERHYPELWTEVIELVGASEAIKGQVSEGVSYRVLDRQDIMQVFSSRDEQHSSYFSNNIVSSAFESLEKDPQPMTVEMAFEVLERYPGLAEKVRGNIAQAKNYLNDRFVVINVGDDPQPPKHGLGALLGGGQTEQTVEPEPQPEPEAEAEPQPQEQEGQAQAGAEPEQAVEPQQEAEPQPEPEAEAEPEADLQAEPEQEYVWTGARREDVIYAQNWAGGGIDSQFEGLLQIEADGLDLDAENRQSLVYALKFNQGWGAINTKSKSWAFTQAAQKLGMDVDELELYIAKHRNESYYTPQNLVDSMWAVVEKAGVPLDSNILEPACGAGAFVVGAPESYQDNARFTMVDLDKIATRFARALLPQATVINDRIEATILRNDFGAVISNVPFGQARITDNKYGDTPYVHDYFIRRSMDSLKPGGVAVLITSRGFMDRQDPSVRQDVMQTSDLIGAVRMPDNMFSNAGARVVTDILVLQKRKPGCSPLRDFTQVGQMTATGVDGEQISMRTNQFFLDNPENVIGGLTMRSTAYGPEPTISTTADMMDVMEAINERLGAQVEDGLYQAALAREPDIELDQQQDVGVQGWDAQAEVAVNIQQQGLIVGQYVLDNDVPVEVVGFEPKFDDAGVHIGRDTMVSRLTLGKRHEQVVRAFIPLRDSAQQLARAQRSGTDEELEQAQKQTLELYNSFVKKFGPISESRNLRVIGDDPTVSEVSSLEDYDPKEKVVVKLADSLSRRVVGVNLDSASIETPEDAYWASLDRTGTADFELMQELSGLSKEQLEKELVGRFVFMNPETELLETENIYLAGNVVKKLELAQKAAALDPLYRANVQALEAVKPEPKAYEDIFFNIGVNWIPAQMVRDWALSMATRSNVKRSDFDVTYNELTGEWDTYVSNSFRQSQNVLFTSTFGTQRAHFGKLLTHALNGTAPNFYIKDDSTGKNALDAEQTQLAADVIKQINMSFKEWVASDEDRTAMIEDLYNSKINVMAVPKVNGDHLSFPGMAEGWVPRQHQKDFIARMMRGLNCGSAHPVGAGKTLEMAAGAYKLKSSGQFNKIGIAVPNHMLEQMNHEIKNIYPTAKVLMVTRDDLHADKRERFMAVARNNDWDMVVLTHSMLDRMAAPLEIQTQHVREQIDIVSVQMEDAIHTGNKRLQKRLADRRSTLYSRLEGIETEYERQKSGESSTRRMFIEDTGIDCLLVDEAHAYKNLNLNTSLDVLGISQDGSKRATNMDEISKYFRSIHNGQPKGLFFFTGTPITNTMAEGFVMVNYLRPDYWESLGCKHFDNWMKNFGTIETKAEILVEGNQVGIRQRATSFDGSFRPIFHEVWDVKLPEELGLPTPDVEYEMVEVMPTKLQNMFQDHLAIRATAIRDGDVEPNVDNLLVVSTEGSKGAVDLQFVDSRIPDAQSGNKLKIAAERIRGFWEQTHEQKGTQMVFLDMGVYKGPDEFSLYSKLKNLLVEKEGLPAEQVVFIHEAKNDKQKEDIFERVRSGDIRVLIGSSQRMGVGTNVQERMVALHSLDVPWRPDITTQRNGRIVRQGNKHFKKVHVLNYIAHNSSEAGRAQKNKYKNEMQRQALRNEDYSKNVEFCENNDVSYEEWMAAATGEPRIAEHAEVNAQYESMLRAKARWESQQTFLRSASVRYQYQIDSYQKQIDLAKQVHKSLPHQSMQTVEVKGEVMGIQEGDTTWFSTSGYAERLGMAAALKRRVESVSAKLMRRGGSNSEDLGISVGGVDFHIRPAVFRGGPDVLVGYLGDEPIAQLTSELTKEAFTTGLALAKRTRKVWEAASWVKDIETLLDRAKADQKNLAKPETVWPQEQELAELKERNDVLSAWMQENDFASKYREMPDRFAEYIKALDAKDRAASAVKDSIMTITQEQRKNGRLKLRSEAGAQEDRGIVYNQSKEQADTSQMPDQYHNTDTDYSLEDDNDVMIDSHDDAMADGEEPAAKRKPMSPGLSM